MTAAAAGSTPAPTSSTTARNCSGSTLDTATIGERSPTGISPRRRATSPAAAPIICAMASSSASRAPAPCSADAASRPCECPMTATGACSAGSSPCNFSARSAASWVSSTPGIDTAADRSTSSLGAAEGSSASGSASSSSSIQATGSNPTGRTTSSWRATGSSSAAASLTSAVSSGSSALSRPISSSSLSHRAPCPPKASAYGVPFSKRSSSGDRPAAAPFPALTTFALAPAPVSVLSLIVKTLRLPSPGDTPSWTRRSLGCAGIRRPLGLIGARIPQNHEEILTFARHPRPYPAVFLYVRTRTAPNMTLPHV